MSTICRNTEHTVALQQQQQSKLTAEERRRLSIDQDPFVNLTPFVINLTVSLISGH
jgi:hypothetical protein